MVTLKSDNRSRVKLPGVKHGVVFAYEVTGETVKLTPVKPVEPKPMKAKLEKRGGYTVVVTDRPVDEKMIKEMLSEFP